MMGKKMLASVLLLVGGLVHLIPALYDWLTELTGDTPWIQIVVGALSVIVALMMFAMKDGGAKKEGGMPPMQQ